MTKDELLQAVAVARTSNNEGTRTALMVDALLAYVASDTPEAAIALVPGADDLDLLQSAIEKAQSDTAALDERLTAHEAAVGEKLTEAELSLSDVGGRLSLVEGAVSDLTAQRVVSIEAKGANEAQPAQPNGENEEYLCTVEGCERSVPGAGYKVQIARDNHVAKRHAKAAK